MLLAEASSSIRDNIMTVYLVEVLPMAKGLRCPGVEK